MKKILVLLLLSIFIISGCVQTSPEETSVIGAWYPYIVEVWDPPFDLENPRTEMEYTPLEKASKKWDICVSFPHMKDSYWLAVNYGVVEEARRLSVKINLIHAGGYENLDTQINQIRKCAQTADGVVIGAISYDGLNELVEELRDDIGIPVIDVINGMSSDKISAKSLVSFGEMGSKAGDYLVSIHPVGSDTVKVAWFPGPEGAGWVIAGDTGFKEAVENSAIEIVTTKYGDTGKAKQTELIEEVLDSDSDIDYIAGTAVTAEAAIDVLKERDLSGKIRVIAYYFTPPVYRGILENTIIAAPTDSTVIQGRIAIDQVVSILEEKEYLKHVGPKIYVIDSANVGVFDRKTSLASDNFRATYIVD